MSTYKIILMPMTVAPLSILRVTSLAVLLLWGLSGCGERPEARFESIDSSVSGIDFINALTETDSLNIHDYLYAYNGGGVALADFDNDGLPDVYFTANQTTNRLYLNRGDMRFEEITASAGVGGPSGADSWTTGVIAVDVNADGWMDIYVSQVTGYRGFVGHNKLYINNGDLTFTERAAEYGLDVHGYCQQAVFFDYDRDGDLDLFQLRHSVHNPDVYLQASLRERRDSMAGDLLLRNDGGRFTDVSETAGIYGGAMGYGLAVGLSDLDGNGCPDIYVSNDFHENDYVYYNQCDGSFREDVRGTLSHSSTFSMGNDIADIDNDGRPDILTLDMKPDEEVLRKSLAGPDPYTIYRYKLGFGYHYQSPRNMLQLNRGNLFADNVQFSEVGELAGLSATDWSWGGLIADLDNDGYKDVFITNGIPRRPIDLDYIDYTYDRGHRDEHSTMELIERMPDGKARNRAFRNVGKWPLDRVGAEWGLDLEGYSTGAAYGDLDNDGDLDLVINNLNAPASLYRNGSTGSDSSHFLRLRLQGPPGNPFGVGSRVTVHSAQQEWVQELFPGRGWLSSVDYTLVFGLGDRTQLDSLTVRWPSGNLQTITGLEVDGTQTVSYNPAHQREPAIAAHDDQLFSDATEDLGLSFAHREDPFVDFTVEGLLPHRLSAEGPRIASGDVNGDGLEDLYFGGAAGQAGELYLQHNSGRFSPARQDAFTLDRLHEDTDAAFFDADGDGDLDLYVVSGGGQDLLPGQLRDRLYRNDGTGVFSRAPQSIPDFSANGSCVVVADLDRDGKPDLFVGTRSIPGRYGHPANSYMLLNDGAGTFRLASPEWSTPLKELGMVTDAVWLPKERTLAIVGEWMPLTLLHAAGGHWQADTLVGTSGWWNTVSAADLDADGRTDLLLGNLGLNTAYTAGGKEWLGLYTDDFDRNLREDPLLTYRRGGREWVYADLKELRKQVPSFRSKFPRYIDYAVADLEDVLTPSQRRGSLYREATLLRSVYFLNRGNGRFAQREFPVEVQYAPTYAIAVADVNGDGHRDVVMAGNSSGFEPSIGRLGASYSTLLLGDGNGDLRATDPEASGLAVYGEVRDLHFLQAGDHRYLVAARNNAAVRVLRTFVPADAR